MTMIRDEHVEYAGQALRMQAKEICNSKVPLQSNIEDEILNGEMTVDANAAIQANESCYVEELIKKYRFSQNGESIRTLEIIEPENLKRLLDDMKRLDGIIKGLKNYEPGRFK